MHRRLLLGGLLLSALIVAAVGCGSSGGSEAPRVENPTVKAKQIPIKSGQSGEGGAGFKAE